MISLIARSKSLVDLIVRVLLPLLPVKLGDVVDDILDAANDDFAALVCHVDDVVKRGEDIIFQHLLVLLTDRVILSLLLIERAHIFFVRHIEWFRTIRSRGCLIVIVLVNHELQIDSSLLTDITLEVLIDLSRERTISGEQTS